MRAAADLETERVSVGYLDDPDRVTILVAEERQRASTDGRLVGVLSLYDSSILADLLVDEELDLPHLIIGNRLDVGEVESQPIGCDERARLSNVGSKHLPECGVQHVGRRVVSGRVLSANGVDVGVDGVAHADLPLGDFAKVHDHARHDFLGVVDDDPSFTADDLAGVANLASALGVEWRFHQDDFDLLALFRSDIASSPEIKPTTTDEAVSCS